MKEISIYFIFSFLEFISLYFMLHKFLNKPIKPTILDIVFAISISLINALIPPENSTLAWFMGQLLYITYAFTLDRTNITYTLLAHIMTMCFALCIQFSIIFIIFIFNIQNEIVAGIIGSVCTTVLSITIFQFTGIKKLYPLVIKSSKLIHMLMLNTYLIYLSALIIFKSDAASLYKNPLLIFTIVTLIVFLNVGLLYYEFRAQKQEQILESYEKNMPIYESLIGDIRSNQHEYSNRLHALSSLPYTCKDYDSLCKALQEYTSEYTLSLHSYSLLQIDMPLLAASLYNLANRAAKNNITVRFDVASNHIVSNAPECVLSDLACILLQNAIEASNPDDFIYVNMKNDNGRLSFEVRNPSYKLYSNDELMSFYKKGYSTKSKEKNSGLGLYYLKNQVNKYDGFTGSECITYNDEIWVVFKLIV